MPADSEGHLRPGFALRTDHTYRCGGKIEAPMQRYPLHEVARKMRLASIGSAALIVRLPPFVITAFDNMSALRRCTQSLHAGTIPDKKLAGRPELEAA